MSAWAERDVLSVIQKEMPSLKPPAACLSPPLGLSLRVSGEGCVGGRDGIKGWGMASG